MIGDVQTDDLDAVMEVSCLMPCISYYTILTIDLGSFLLITNLHWGSSRQSPAHLLLSYPVYRMPLSAKVNTKPD